MRLHRFIGSFVFDQSIITITDEHVIRQVRDILRIGIGEQCILCDGNGKEVVIKIQKMAAGLLAAEILERRASIPEPKRHVILYCAVLKRDNFEYVIQKTTEVGVTEIIPIITKRTVKLSVPQTRLTKIAQEAAEQSGRGIVPVIHAPMNLSQSIIIAQNNQQNIVFDTEDLTLPSSSSLLSSPILSSSSSRTGIFIGPEGGWGPTEIAKFQKNDFVFKSLGPRILRAETAAVVATYLYTQDPLQLPLRKGESTR